MTSTVLGDVGHFSMEGRTKIIKANEAVNINPYNIATIKGVGEGNHLQLLDTYGMLDLPLSAPLYQMTEGYKDRILQKDGVWGVERNIGVKVFDGTEDWQLVKQPGYRNDNTTLFSCSIKEEALLWNGMSTHFDVFTKEMQKSNRYDGISFGADLSEIYMRIMNVRKVTTTEELKAYLKNQLDSGHPVKFLYIRKDPIFEPFEDDIQQKLNYVNWDNIGFMDASLQKVSKSENEKVNANKNIFVTTKTDNEVFNQFLSAITSLHIYNGKEENRYFLEGIYPTNSGLQIVIQDEMGNRWKGEISFMGNNFLSKRPVEVILRGEDNGETVMRMQVDLSIIQIPKESIYGFTFEETAIKDSCIMQKTLVLPQKIPFVKGKDAKLYLDNTVLYGNLQKTKVVVKSSDKDISSDEQVVTVSGSHVEPVETEFFLEDAPQSIGTVEWIPVDKNVGAKQERTILFLGDSLLNQDLYTEFVEKLFEDDSMNVALIGTRGSENARHEGRGGWAAFDYCNVDSKYGFTNPFLKEGKFDFTYYMNQNKFSNVDSVVINLGINDLNLLEHNSHEEILGYYDEIIQSIHEYNSDTKILLNLPALLFGGEKTQTAKDTRLSFIQTMQSVYGDKEKEGIYIVPIYASIDPRMGYKWVQPTINEYNQNHSLMVTDTTHPNHAGYQSIAETTYAYLKYLETIK